MCRCLTVLALLACLALLGGCAGKAPVEPEIDREADLEDVPMIALEGYRGANDFFVRYRHGDEIRYAGGNWSDRIELVDDTDAAPENYATPTLVPMQYHQQAPWETLPDDAVSVPILDVEVWQTLRNRLLLSVVPDDGTGVVVDFVYDAYFLYYDADGNFHATRFQDKPADYRVRERLRFDEFMRRGRPILDTFLAERGITATEFVFNTGDFGPYSLPFLYLNRDRQLLVFVRYVPPRPVTPGTPPGFKSGQAVSHLLSSHITNLALRPVSSLYRLFFVLTDTAVSTVRLDWMAALNDMPVPPPGNEPAMDLQQWEKDLDRISSRPATSGSVEFLVDGEAFFTRLVDTVSMAEESVLLQAYIFDNDDYAVKIAELLKRRSNEGVEVKVLLDGLGTISGTMTDPDSIPGDHQAPASVRGFLETDSEVNVRQRANPWFTGDHVKITVIDQQTAFVGGMNIGREYRYDWHDLMLEVQGPVVDSLQREFRLAWAHSGLAGDLGYLSARAKPLEQRNGEQGYPLRLLLTSTGNVEIYEAQLEAINRAQRYIYIQNAYFTDDRLLRDLVMARRRGVDVRVIIPLETDLGPIERSNILAANLMLKHGIRVYIYPRFSHVKASIYDGWVSIGSANFDRLSLRLNRELNIASSSPEVAQQLLDQLFEPDFEASLELTEPVPDRWVDHLVEILGDYLF